MTEKDSPGKGPDRHGLARRLAEKAQEAFAAGDETQAEELQDQAGQTDPDAVANVLNEGGRPAVLPVDAAPASDEEVAAITRTVQPGSSAGSRAGITGDGSGADAQGVSTGLSPRKT